PLFQLSRPCVDAHQLRRDHQRPAGRLVYDFEPAPRLSVPRRRKPRGAGPVQREIDHALLASVELFSHRLSHTIPKPLSRSAAFPISPTDHSAIPWPGALPVVPSGRMNLVFPFGNRMTCAFGAHSCHQPLDVYARTTATPLPCAKNFRNHGT